MKVFRKILDKVFSLVLYIGMTLLICMVLIVFINVVLRYGFSSGIRWGEEIPLVIVIWFTFIAMALGVKENLHINISVLPKRIPFGFEKFLGILKYTLEIIIGGIMFRYGIGLTQNGFRSFLPATHISNAINYIILPISAIFIILYAFLYLIDEIKAKNHKELVKEEIKNV
ncbi:MAG: TRAP transporter small permease [Sphaerochaetaceae bacterium]